MYLRVIQDASGRVFRQPYEDVVGAVFQGSFTASRATELADPPRSEVYAALLAFAPAWRAYLAYAALRRSGYVVHRAEAPEREEDIPLHPGHAHVPARTKLQCKRCRVLERSSGV